MAGLYRRNGVYWARAQRNGREFRQSLKTRDRGDANRRLETWLKRLDAIAWGERPRISFNEAVRQFILEHLPTLKPSAARRYAVSLKWLADKFDGRFLDEINRQSLSEFETTRRSAGASPPTVRRDLACLSSVLAMCEDKDWMEEGKNPVPGFLRRRAKRGLKEGQARMRYLSHTEEAACLSVASAPLREAIILAIETGLREQELFSLTWPQVDLRTRTITTTRDTKNRRARVVPLGERAAQFLAQWKGSQTGAVVSLYVFHHEDGSRYRNLYKGFKAIARRIGIADINWHDLRRTAGCRWLQDQGKSLAEVMTMLGHSSVLVTEKSYAFLDGRKVAENTAAQKPAQRVADSSASD
jgi:integrase